MQRCRQQAGGPSAGRRPLRDRAATCEPSSGGPASRPNRRCSWTRACDGGIWSRSLRPDSAASARNWPDVGEVDSPAADVVSRSRSPVSSSPSHHRWTTLCSNSNSSRASTSSRPPGLAGRRARSGTGGPRPWNREVGWGDGGCRSRDGSAVDMLQRRQFGGSSDGSTGRQSSWVAGASWLLGRGVLGFVQLPATPRCRCSRTAGRARPSGRPAST